MKKKLKLLEKKDPNNAILVVTEGLYSMDSDYQDIVELQQICKKYDAFLMIDCSHDFGCMGDGGKGTWEIQNLQDRSNVILMATGSKSFSTNIGWAGCNDPNVIDYLKVYSPSYMFVNSISPIQAATAMENLRMIRSEEGKVIRKKVLELSKYMRGKLQMKGYKILGFPSPIVPLVIGNEILCRLTVRILLDEGVVVNGVEFPGVAKGTARLRIALTPLHTYEQLDKFIETFERCLAKASAMIRKSVEPEIADAMNLPQPKL